MIVISLNLNKLVLLVDSYFATFKQARLDILANFKKARINGYFAIIAITTIINIIIIVIN